jgi:protein SCO1
MTCRIRAGVALGLMLVVGCGRGEVTKDEAPDPARAARSGTKVFALKGVVRKVDPASGEVMIAHETIPGFMPAMTMPFTLADKTLLEDVRPGDEVEAPLRVQFADDGRAKDYQLEDFAVTTQDGAHLMLSDLRGSVVALTFIYTRCPLPDFCPAVDAKFAEMARQLAAVPGRSEGVRLLSVSFDPEHDDPASLAAHAKRWGANPPLWQFAVASHEELRKVAAPLGLGYGPAGNEILHNLCTAVIDPEGRLARLESGPRGRRWAPADLLATIRGLAPRRDPD